MTYDPAITDTLRDALQGLSVTEKKMFGGLAFMWRGHMLCGTLNDGAILRVGPDNYAAALAHEGAAPMLFTGREMRGFITASADLVDDPDRLAPLLCMAQDFVGALPAK